MVLAVSLASKAAASEGPLFEAAFLSFDAGQNTRGEATGDLGGDGRLDLAAANAGSGTFDWTPGFDQAGTAPVTFAASNAPPGTGARRTVSDVDRPPEVTAPASVSGVAGGFLGFTVAASDPDGDPIESLRAAPLPPGAAFVQAPGNASGSFAWTPDFAQVGMYSVVISAESACRPIGVSGPVVCATGTATVEITVVNADRPPVVTAPTSQTGTEGLLLTFTVTISDPDGDPISSLTAAPLPSGASFASNGTNTAGTFNWTPTVGQAGVYSIAFTATNALSASASASITILAGPERPPVVTVPPLVNGVEGTLFTFTVTAADPNGDPIDSLTAGPLPVGATFTRAQDHSSGTFSWTPSFTQAGTYAVAISAKSACRASGVSAPLIICDTGTDTVAIHIANVDLPPVVTAPASVSGEEGAPLTFTVGADDPDGDPVDSLTAAPLPPGATFAAGPGNTSGTFSWTPDFAQAGTYDVTISAMSACRATGVSYPVVWCNTGTAAVVLDIANVNRPPVLDHPLDMVLAEGDTLGQTLTASDPDGTRPSIYLLSAPPFVSLAVSPAPPGSGPDSTAAATLMLFPLAGDAAGSPYTVSVAATDGALIVQDSLTITVNAAADQPPLVTAPSAVSGEEDGTIIIAVTASDPDADAITSLVADASALPPPNPPSFSTDATNTQGTLSWTPAAGNAGTYDVTFVASNALVSAPAVTQISVAPLGIDATAEFTWTPTPPDTGHFYVTFTATDSDGESASATTEVTVLPAPGTGSDTVSRPLAHRSPAAPVRGPIISAPREATIDAGQTVNFTVSAYDPDGGSIISIGADLSGLPPENTATFTTDLGPIVNAPVEESTAEGSALAFQVTATDPDADAILSLEADLSGLPLGNDALFTADAPDHGTFAWTPGFDAAGQYVVSFIATNALVGSSSTSILVIQTNRAPVADPGGPYSGAVGAAVSFTGTRSSDPDGDALTYAWEFGDGTSGVGEVVQHAYASTGTYDVRLTVSDGALLDTDGTTAAIHENLAARAFTTGGDRVIRLRSGKPAWCVSIEPVASSFSASDVDVPTIRLISAGTGSVGEIQAVGGKSSVDGDTDRNGVSEVQACFTKASLRLLFSQVVGDVTLPVAVEGRLLSGAGFRAELLVNVIGSSGALSAAVNPNPFNPSATLTFETRKAGPVRVLLFATSGRLMRTLLQASHVPPGIHDVAVDGNDESGGRLSSGIYLYRIEAAEGVCVGRAVLLK